MNQLKTVHTKNSILAIGGFILAAIGLSACAPGTGGGGYHDPYRRAWYDVYGNQCISYGHPMAGCNFYANGNKIQLGSDPYHNLVDMQYDVWGYTDSYGYWRNYVGSAWLSPTGILYDVYGNALNEMNEAELQSLDVIAVAAEKETLMAKAAGKKFAAEFALAEDTGVAVAKTLQDWATLGRDRSRTAQDIEDFGKRLYGVNPEQAKAAIESAIKGNTAPIVELNIDVASHWGTSPETSRAILSRWYKDEMQVVGLKP